VVVKVVVVVVVVVRAGYFFSQARYHLRSLGDPHSRSNDKQPLQHF
jgi:hypothetical protein